MDVAQLVCSVGYPLEGFLVFFAGVVGTVDVEVDSSVTAGRTFFFFLPVRLSLM
jgi:hypothetical protein